MIHHPTNGREFPRELLPLEREMIFRQLPRSSNTYRSYHDAISQMKVAGFGRRGAGHFVLSHDIPSDDILDLLTPVFAIGGAVDESSELTIVIHEMEQNSISFELMPVKGELEDFRIGNAKSWSLSDWLPGKNCPKCLSSVREITLRRMNDAVLAICPRHNAIWVWDAIQQMNHIIPLTALMNELNLQRVMKSGKRDYESPSKVFSEIDRFTDNDFKHAFLLYNKYSHKLELNDSEISPPDQSTRRSGFLGGIFRGSRRTAGISRPRKAGNSQ